MSNGAKRQNKLRIGILINIDEKWMGGLNYIANTLRTLDSLSPSQKPELTVLVRSGTMNGLKIFKEQFPEIKTCYLAEMPYWIKLFPGRYRNRAWGRFKEIKTNSILKCHNIDIVFPVTGASDFKLPVKCIGWIPDFQHRYLPEFFLPEDVRWRDSTYADFAEHADYMVFSSQNARKDYENFYPKHKSRNFVYSFCTVLDKNCVIKDKKYLKKKYGIEDKFFLMPNQFWVHKNHLRLFKAVAQLNRKGNNITVICTGSNYEHRNKTYYDELLRFKEENKLNNIKILGLVSHEDLYTLYFHAHAVVQPSLFEGWSSIVEDCRAFGKTLILSDIPVHREQNPPDAIFFNPLDLEELEGSLAQVWNRKFSQMDYDDLVQNQKNYVKETAHSIIDIFNTVKMTKH